MLKEIIWLTEYELKEYLQEVLQERGYAPVNKEGFLYAPGNVPVMLIAHLDTVHHKRVETLYVDRKKGVYSSPQGIGGDDRCGVFIILRILQSITKEGLFPHILFTEGEEIGGVGATAFTASGIIPDIKYMIELDRMGRNDAVFYSCDNLDFIEYVEKFKFQESWGSFSDISIIAPHLKVAACNLSSGYYSPHTLNESISLPDMRYNISRVIDMIKDIDNAPKFEYKEKKYRPYRCNSFLWREFGEGECSYCGEPVIPPRTVCKVCLSLITDVYKQRNSRM